MRPSRVRAPSSSSSCEFHGFVGRAKGVDLGNVGCSSSCSHCLTHRCQAHVDSFKASWGRGAFLHVSLPSLQMDGSVSHLL